MPDLVSAVAIIYLALAAAWDYKEGRIPNVLTFVAGTVGLFLVGSQDFQLLTMHLVSSAIAGLLLLGVRWLGIVLLKKPGMGWGDVKMGAALGVILGWTALWVLYLAALAGAVIGVAGRGLGVLKSKQRVPFAPFALAGLLLALYVVPLEQVLSWITP